MDERLRGVAVSTWWSRAASRRRAAARRHALGCREGRRAARAPPRRAAPAAHDPPARPDRRGRLLRAVPAAAGRTRRDGGRARRGQREPAGRLRVSVPVLFGRQCVAPVMRRLVERHPRLEIDVSFSDRVADLVNDGFDIAVRIGELADTSALVGRKLGVQRMGICASPAYLDRHGRPAGSTRSRRTSASRIRAAGNRHRGGSSARTARCTTIARPAACGSTTCRRSPMRPPPARASRGCRAG